MFEKFYIYTVICDRCGKDAFADSEFCGWDSRKLALERAREEDFVEIGDKHVCSDCWEWSEDVEDYVIKKSEKGE